MKKISVVIISYNQKEYLKEAIESVLNQTYRPFEIIVCDDASKDGSVDLINYYERKFPGLVKGIFHEKNIGIAKNRNSGLSTVQGDLVTWLDGDDIFRPRKLELESGHYEHDPDVRWVYSQVIEIDVKNSEIRGRYKGFLEGIIFDEVVSMLGYAPRNPLVEFEVLKQVGFFDEDMELYEDFDLCLRLAKFYKCSYCPEPLMEYRIHRGGIHKTLSDKHVANLQKLRNNLTVLLRDESNEKKRRLERCFFLRQNALLMAKDIESGNFLNALLRLFKEVVFNPVSILSLRTYVIFLKIVLPGNSIRFIRKLLEGLRYE